MTDKIAFIEGLEPIHWQLADRLDPVAYACNQHLDRLAGLIDDANRVWGKDGLISISSPELQERWKQLTHKIHDAVKRQDLNELVALVDGAARGLKKMHTDAVAAGRWPDLASKRHFYIGDQEIVVCVDNKPGEGQVGLEELVRVYDMYLNKKLVFMGA